MWKTSGSEWTFYHSNYKKVRAYLYQTQKYSRTVQALEEEDIRSMNGDNKPMLIEMDAFTTIGIS